MLNKLRIDKKGVFGLTAVQSFFGIIIGIALLAYVIVIIMGTLGGTSILPQASNSFTAEQLSTNLTQTPQSVSKSTLSGFNGFAVTTLLSKNTTGTYKVVPATNYTSTSAGTIAFVTTGIDVQFNNTLVILNYTYKSDTQQQQNANNILGNTSSGISGFFSNINPVYAILAVLVIILVLVVLVRVVQAPSGRAESPSL